jgi:hypothetical protein
VVVALLVGQNTRIPPTLEVQSVAGAEVHLPPEESVAVAVEEARRNLHLEQRMSGREMLSWFITLFLLSSSQLGM